MAGPRLLFSTAAFFARPLGDTFALVVNRGSAAEVLRLGEGSTVVLE